jgi:F-type H+-transporting ATPase subunit a
VGITPDNTVFWQWGFVKLNATIVYTWVVMVLLVVGAWLVTRNLSRGPQLSRGQNLLEVLVEAIRNQIREVSQQEAGKYLAFVGTLFLFIAVANLLSIVPGYKPPTASLSTTAGLAICVFIAVPLYGIAEQGLGRYLKQYLEPTPLMLPFNLISELSRTIALAIRLFGNVMSGTIIVGIIISIAPLFFPIVLQLLGLLTGMVQAYIFAILAMVYIASATGARRQSQEAREQ